MARARSSASDFFRVILGVYWGCFCEVEVVDVLSKQASNGNAVAVCVLPGLVLGVLVQCQTEAAGCFE